MPKGRSFSIRNFVRTFCDFILGYLERIDPTNLLSWCKKDPQMCKEGTAARGNA
jgi:hypothetical protein